MKSLFTINGRPLEFRLWLPCSMLAAALLGGAFAAQAQSWQAPIRGGSNFENYGFVPGDFYGTADTYVVSNFDQRNPGYSIMVSQLQAMANEGQRTIRIPISFTSDTQYSTDCSGSSGNYDIMVLSNLQLSSQCLQNFQALLAEIKKDGFQYIELGMWPSYHNNPNNWTSWDEATYQTNWNFIVNLRTIARQTLTDPTQMPPPPPYPPIYFDLQNELSTAGPNGGIQVEYMQRLWGDYVYNYGKSDTFGFSMALDGQSDESAIVQSLNTIYNYYFDPCCGLSPSFGPPDIIEAHIETGDSSTDSTLLQNLDSDLAANGIGSTIVLSEALYQNENDAVGLATAAEAILTGPNQRQVWWLMQWPLWDLSDPCLQSGVDEPLSNQPDQCPAGQSNAPQDSFLHFSTFFNAGW